MKVKRFFLIWQNERATSHQNKGFFWFSQVNFLYQKFAEALWKWFSHFCYWHDIMCCILEIFYFVKMCPIFDGVFPTDFEKYGKKHLAPMNIEYGPKELGTYSIWDASNQIVLPWITITPTSSVPPLPLTVNIDFFLFWNRKKWAVTIVFPILK